MRWFFKSRHLGKPNWREIIETTIRARESFGYMARPGLLEDALLLVKDIKDPDDAIDELERLFSEGMVGVTNGA